ncbi:hypothetical protein [Limosilactobacillus caecicola]|uniref:hypothetical protein n=1 Tax=Limosilactobacillus caecicola TaxID=2941332 RepID=UPI00203C39CB|nr:hypothetical protein [Limosilactobacillus caecicola]
MKIDELAKTLNGLDGVVCDVKQEDIHIDICENPNKTDYPHWSVVIIDLPIKAASWLDAKLSSNSHQRLAIQQEVACWINEYLATPVEERFSEKKYVLSTMRCVEGPIAIKQYVTAFQASGDYVTFDFGSEEEAQKWTDKELHDFTQWFPKEAIEAMKEEA